MQALQASLQAVLTDLSRTTPELPRLTRNLANTTESLPLLVVQTEQSLDNLDELLQQLRRHWLLGGRRSEAQQEPSRRLSCGNHAMSYGRACCWVRPLAPLLVAAQLVGISACSSRQTPQPTAAVDERLDRTSRVAGMAFGLREYARAADLYRQALVRAYARDDRQAIVDTQYNLAVVLLRLGALEEAAAVVDDARAELSRAAQAVPAHLLLLETTIFYRTGDGCRLGYQRTAFGRGCRDGARRHRQGAVFARSDGGTVSRHGTASGSCDRARDGRRSGTARYHAELRGYLALAEHSWPAAVQAFDAAAALRRESLDYVSMGRALALAGGASERSGHQRMAAVFYLRAGRSAAQLGRKQEALHWLMQAQFWPGKRGTPERCKKSWRTLPGLRRLNLARVDRPAAPLR